MRENELLGCSKIGEGSGISAKYKYQSFVHIFYYISSACTVCPCALVNYLLWLQIALPAMEETTDGLKYDLGHV